MEAHDEILINKLMPQYPELKKLMDDHIEYEKRLDELNSLSYLTPKEDQERKVIQKAKLRGKDKIEFIIAPHRSQ
ncbi:MAG: DUF465 domain-containing protein [Deltaproteobacteria bacterium]|jgi:uncharacterized protein YdcH (DUF465 family)|nr:DUF465 domain-containing protein [Deltaproteobacteria bacterium]